jgi:hypothetical protein
VLLILPVGGATAVGEKKRINREKVAKVVTKFSHPSLIAHAASID